MVYLFVDFADFECKGVDKEAVEFQRVEDVHLTKIIIKDSLRNTSPAHERVRMLTKLLVQQDEAANEGQGDRWEHLGPEQQLVKHIFALPVVFRIYLVCAAFYANRLVVVLQRLFEGPVYFDIRQTNILQKELIEREEAADLVVQ